MSDSLFLSYHLLCMITCISNSSYTNIIHASILVLDILLCEQNLSQRPDIAPEVHIVLSKYY
jgi:hypothetical protein